MTYVSFKGRCRGDGKLYMLFDGDANSVLSVRSSSDGKPLPSRLLWLDDTEFVVILSDFTHRQRLSILSDGSTVFSMTINPSAFAISSKVNGVLHKNLCAKIRNIDRSGLESLSSVSLDAVVPCEHGAILRGHVSNYPTTDDNAVVAYDESGKVIGRSIWLSSESSASGNRYFSISISDWPKGLCLSLLNGDSQHTGAFTCLKPRIFADFLELHESDYASAFDGPGYIEWLSDHRLSQSSAELQREYRFDYSPLFSVIVPLYKTPLNFFRDMADSVLAQTYANWELVLVNSTPEEAELKTLVTEYVNRDSRIKVIELDKNYGITGNTNEGIKVASGDYVCFFDHDDVLEPDILFEYARAINETPDTSLLYCDEDKLLPDGTFANPTFKPDFSLDMVRDNNYICHLLTVKRELLSKIEPSGPELDGAQDHAMVLKIAELGGPIKHISKILYHWRISPTSTAGNADSKPYASIAGIRAVQEHLDRLGIKAVVSSAHDRAFRYSPKYTVPADCVVSIIVPSRGVAKDIDRLISNFALTQNVKFEVIVVCSNSAEAIPSFELPVTCVGVRAVEAVQPFNYGAWCNFGASAAKGDVLVFAHDDIRPDNPEWLYILAGFALRKDVGVVGTMTCDPDGIVQQAGISFVGDSLVKLSRGIHESSIGYIFMPLTVRNVAAVSGVCMATSREAFDRLGGFNEAYNLDYHDADYCFRASSHGLRVVYTPESRLYHLSNTDRQLEHSMRSRKHFEDKARLLSDWSGLFAQGDPFFNDQFSEDPIRAALYKLPVLCNGIG